MAMKPVAKRLDLGEPEFQLCKGTRMYEKDGAWVDMRGDISNAKIMESLAETALREGVEELGLQLENIETLYDLGLFSFTSASTRKPISLWIFAAAIRSEENFLPLESIANVTTERAFFTLGEFKKAGRADHHYMLGQIDTIISRHCEER